MKRRSDAIYLTEMGAFIARRINYRRHVDYIYINPLKHGYVGKVSDWPYSTFHRDVAEGLYPVDWAGEIEDFAAGERK